MLKIIFKRLQFDKSIKTISRLNSTNKSGSYVAQRTEYKNKISELRKVWKKDYFDEVERFEIQKKEERSRIVKEKAVKLRERRILSLARQEADRKLKAKAMIRFKNYLAKQHIEWDWKYLAQQKRFEHVSNDLVEEQSTWITSDNINDRIIEDLFDKESATTGILTKYSNYWRYYVRSDEYHFKKVFNDDDTHDERHIHENAELTDRLKTMEQTRFSKTLFVKRFIKNFAATGVDLSKVDEYADKYIKLAEGMQPNYTENPYRRYRPSLENFDNFKNDMLSAQEILEYESNHPEEFNDDDIEDIDDDDSENNIEGDKRNNTTA